MCSMVRGGGRGVDGGGGGGGGGGGVGWRGGMVARYQVLAATGEWQLS